MVDQHSFGGGALPIEDASRRMTARSTGDSVEIAYPAVRVPATWFELGPLDVTPGPERHWWATAPHDSTSFQSYTLNNDLMTTRFDSL